MSKLVGEQLFSSLASLLSKCKLLKALSPMSCSTPDVNWEANFFFFNSLSKKLSEAMGLNTSITEFMI